MAAVVVVVVVAVVAAVVGGVVVVVAVAAIVAAVGHTFSRKLRWRLSPTTLWREMRRPILTFMMPAAQFCSLKLRVDRAMQLQRCCCTF